MLTHIPIMVLIVDEGVGRYRSYLVIETRIYRTEFSMGIIVLYISLCFSRNIFSHQSLSLVDNMVRSFAGHTILIQQTTFRRKSRKYPTAQTKNT